MSSIAVIHKRLFVKTVIDGRNVLDRESWQRAGFTYRGVGR